MSSEELCYKEEWHGCCCTCKHQIEVRKHPWNKIEPMKGSVIETVGYLCDTPEMYTDKRIGIFLDRQHSFCECYEKKNDS